MKITKITVTSEAVLNYQKSIYSMEVELDEMYNDPNFLNNYNIDSSEWR